MTYTKFLAEQIRLVTPLLQRFFVAESFTAMLFRPYRGRRGPKTFTGTPMGVVSAMRRYQQGLS